MDMYMDEVISFEDTGGLEIRFGDAETMVELVRLTGLREGFGSQLADGSYRLAEKYGHPEYSMSVKKQEMPAYDPRGVQGMGLQYATSNRGGCHVRGYTISPEVLGIPFKVDQHATDGKAEIVITFQNLAAALDSMGSCLFTTFGIGAEELAALLSAVTGVNYTTEDFMKAGDRIWNLERQWNLKVGMTSADDSLPKRMLNDPIPSGPSKGKVNLLHKMLPEYYKLRGWDLDGIPTRKKLKELSLV
jgi:aldehyde:ferredoxin oxidoreductase